MNKHEEILSKYETTLFNKNGQPVKAVTLINAGEALKEYGETLAASPASPVREAAENILHLHLCEQEGLQSGQPTPQMWMEAVDKLSEALAANHLNK
jgi:hypothetical protein